MGQVAMGEVFVCVWALSFNGETESQRGKGPP